MSLGIQPFYSIEFLRTFKIDKINFSYSSQRKNMPKPYLTGKEMC